jgi:hypothetical protein
VEVERAKGRGCPSRSAKLAQLVRYCSFSAEDVTIALSAAQLRAVPVEEHMGGESALEEGETKEVTWAAPFSFLLG